MLGPLYCEQVVVLPLNVNSLFKSLRCDSTLGPVFTVPEVDALPGVLSGLLDL